MKKVSAKIFEVKISPLFYQFIYYESQNTSAAKQKLRIQKISIIKQVFINFYCSAVTASSIFNKAVTADHQ